MANEDLPWRVVMRWTLRAARVADDGTTDYGRVPLQLVVRASGDPDDPTIEGALRWMDLDRGPRLALLSEDDPPEELPPATIRLVGGVAWHWGHAAADAMERAA